jgi:hypothetical protein
MDYYARLQAECDAGHRPNLLDPRQVAMEFVASFFEDTPAQESLELR